MAGLLNRYGAKMDIGGTVTLQDGVHGHVVRTYACPTADHCGKVCRGEKNRVVVETEGTEHDVCANHVFDGSLEKDDFVKAYCVALMRLAGTGHSMHLCFRACKLYPGHCDGETLGYYSCTERLPEGFDVESAFGLIPMGFFPISDRRESNWISDLILDDRFPNGLLEIEEPMVP